MLTGLASQAYAASVRACSRACWCERGQLRPAILECPLAIGGHQALHRFDQRRQCRFRIGGDRQIDFLIALEVLVIALVEKIAGVMLINFAPGLSIRVRTPYIQLLAERVNRAPEIVHFKAEDYVRIRDRSSPSHGLIQRMPRREVHAPVLIDHRACSIPRVRQELQPRRRTRHAVRDNHRIFRGHEQPRGFGHGPESPCGGAARVSFGIRKLCVHRESGFPAVSPSATSTTGIGGVMAIL